MKAGQPVIIALLTVTLTLSSATGEVSHASDNYQYFARKLPAPKPAPAFTLTDQDGKPFSLKNLRGNIVLMSFGFTHCPNACPTALANLDNIYKLLPPENRTRV